MNIVRKTRELGHLSQSELAELIGISRRQIINQEQGHSSITRPYALLMACIQELGVNNIRIIAGQLSEYEFEEDK